MATRPVLLNTAIRSLGYPTAMAERMTTAQLEQIVSEGKQYEIRANPLPAPTPAAPMPANDSPSPAAPASSAGKLGALLDVLASDVAEKVRGDIKADLQAEFAAALDNRPRELAITIKQGDNEAELPAGLRHASYARLLSLCLVRSRRLTPYLHGPAGSGKTYAARMLAEDIGKIIGQPLTCERQSFGPSTQMHELIGIPPINGHPAQMTPLWRAWDHGGVVLLDELDAAPELFVSLNGALEDGMIVFADGERHQMHPHCYVIAAGNTTGIGPSEQYTSRARQDKATLNRFAFVAWDYDPALELAAAGAAQAKWVKHVQSLRAALVALGDSAPDIIITPRASINGAAYLAEVEGSTFDDAEEFFVWAGTSEDDRQKVRAKMRQQANG